MFLAIPQHFCYNSTGQPCIAISDSLDEYICHLIGFNVVYRNLISQRSLWAPFRVGNFSGSLSVPAIKRSIRKVKCIQI